MVTRRTGFECWRERFTRPACRSKFKFHAAAFPGIFRFLSSSLQQLHHRTSRTRNMLIRSTADRSLRPFYLHTLFAGRWGTFVSSFLVWSIADSPSTSLWIYIGKLWREKFIFDMKLILRYYFSVQVPILFLLRYVSIPKYRQFVKLRRSTQILFRSSRKIEDGWKRIKLSLWFLYSKTRPSHFEIVQKISFT